MAANYWSSSQFKHWLFSRKTLSEMRCALEEADQSIVQHYPLPDRRHLSIFFQQQLMKLGKRIHVRQQALATAQVYIRRLYIKVEIRRTNPYLVVATALYLACKMEECPQHIRAIVGEARTLWPDFVGADVSKLGECEFFLISELNCQLIVHHPYRTLLSLQKPLHIADDEISLAWSIINDHYLTDLPLLYPLHVIASTAIFMSLVLKPSQTGGMHGAADSIAALAQGLQSSQAAVGVAKAATSTSWSSIGSSTNTGHGNSSIIGIGTSVMTGTGGSNASSFTSGAPSGMTTGTASGISSVGSHPDDAAGQQQNKVQYLLSWIAEGEIDIQSMVECTQDIISLYEVLEVYEEKSCKEQIARFVKARNLDR